MKYFFTAVMTAFLWATIVPNGDALCASDKPFASLNDQAGVAAAKLAKGKFCMALADYHKLYQ
jgi:hypothetical protein